MSIHPTVATKEDRRRATLAMGKALREGTLTRAAECEGEGCRWEYYSVHGHHDDYSKPLKVRWLCPSCHGRTHARLRKAAGLRLVGKRRKQLQNKVPTTIRLDPATEEKARQRWRALLSSGPYVSWSAFLAGLVKGAVDAR